MAWIWYPASPDSGSERAAYLPEPWAPTAQFLGLEVQGLRAHAVADAPVSTLRPDTPCSPSRRAGSRRST